MLELLKLAARPRALRTSLCVALVVGCILNLINQGERMFDETESVHWGHILLNFLVPFCVSSLSAALNTRKGGSQE